MKSSFCEKTQNLVKNEGSSRKTGKSAKKANQSYQYVKSFNGIFIVQLKFKYKKIRLCWKVSRPTEILQIMKNTSKIENGV